MGCSIWSGPSRRYEIRRASRWKSLDEMRFRFARIRDIGEYPHAQASINSGGERDTRRLAVVCAAVYSGVLLGRATGGRIGSWEARVWRGASLPTLRRRQPSEELILWVPAATTEVVAPILGWRSLGSSSLPKSYLGRCGLRNRASGAFREGPRPGSCVGGARCAAVTGHQKEGTPRQFGPVVTPSPVPVNRAVGCNALVSPHARDTALS